MSTVLWARGSSVVARVRHGDVAAVSGDRTSVSVNGTLRLHDVRKSDGGAYKVEGHDGSGSCAFREHVWLEVRDPVSRPAVSVVSCECGRASLRCEVERGDNVSFRWAVPGGSANASLGAGALLSVEVGDRRELVCVASNGVSAETSDPLTPDCPDAVTPYRVSETEATEGYKNYARLKLCIELFLGACGVLLAILFAILCIASRDREGPNTERGPSPEETGVVYSQVRITNRDK
ncbi:T-cell surface antigen CD2-like isoform X2 [Anguilla anguilla]|nr:T-cell surface antigen CD2-like isoform X2 [Anguilla anguilla]